MSNESRPRCPRDGCGGSLVRDRDGRVACLSCSRSITPESEPLPLVNGRQTEPRLYGGRRERSTSGGVI